VWKVFVCLCVLTLTEGRAVSQTDSDWRGWMDRGNTAERAGDYATAAAAYREAVAVADHFPQNDHRRIFGYNSLAMMCDALGQFPDAEARYRQALAAAAESIGKQSHDYALILSNLGSLYVEMGQAGRGERVVREAMALQMALEHPDEVRIAMGRNILAEIVLLKGKYGESERLLTASIEVLTKHPEAWGETAVAENNLGVVRGYQKRFAEAEKLLLESIQIQEGHGGRDHPMVIRTINNLATVLYRSGKKREAGEALQRALSIAERRLGEEHPVYGTVLQNYAGFLRMTGEKSRAKSLQARATKILQESQRSTGSGAVIDISALK
jgi:tetratricopeptide (TPR) repeat protein